MVNFLFKKKSIYETYIGDTNSPKAYMFPKNKQAYIMIQIKISPKCYM